MAVPDENGGGGAAAVAVKPYPAPEADYDEIVHDASLFSEKLRRFHASFNTELSFPNIGGKELDLHRLFVQVTSRSGLEKVIRERKWEEVVSGFDFPSTVKNASFALRRYYLSLLYHFEQAYYFRKTVPTVSVPPSESNVTPDANASPTLQTGISLIGVIERKCDNGYIVSVNLGSEKLTGILYHIPNMPQSSCSSDTSANQQRTRKKQRMRFDDPSRPKPNRSGYTFFFAEQYARLSSTYGGNARTISKEIGSLWNELSDGERQVYQDKAVRDKERYRSELFEYNMSHDL
ncbi:High mobility group B protein 10-like protein [Drosera capensis]